MQDQIKKYTSSIVLGLNDALVEITGALAGLTLALRDTKIIGVVGLITGLAAAMSMAGSEYLSTEEEDSKKQASTAGIITGLAYLGGVVLLILPYFLLTTPLTALAGTVIMSIIIILGFSYYSSQIKEENKFLAKLKEMIVISLGVATINFFIGRLIRAYFDISI